MVGSWLMKAVSPQIKISITYRDTPLEIWNDLRDMHSQGNGPRVFQLQKDIASINRGDSSITTYFTQLKVYWDQLKNFRPTITCSCEKCTCNISQRIQNLHFQDLVMQFLMGLSDSYSQIKGQRNVGNSNVHIESTALVVKGSNSIVINSNSGFSGGKNSMGKDRPICTHCGKHGHTMEKCFKLHGFPPGFKSKRKTSMVNQVGIQDGTAEKGKSSNDATQFPFTQEQCQQFLAMLGNQMQATTQLNMGTKEVHMASSVIKPHSDSQLASSASASKSDNALTMLSISSFWRS